MQSPGLKDQGIRKRYKLFAGKKASSLSHPSAVEELWSLRIVVLFLELHLLPSLVLGPLTIIHSKGLLQPAECALLLFYALAPSLRGCPRPHRSAVVIRRHRHIAEHARAAMT